MTCPYCGAEIVADEDALKGIRPVNDGEGCEFCRPQSNDEDE